MILCNPSLPFPSARHVCRDLLQPVQRLIPAKILRKERLHLDVTQNFIGDSRGEIADVIGFGASVGLDPEWKTRRWSSLQRFPASFTPKEFSKTLHLLNPGPPHPCSRTFLEQPILTNTAKSDQLVAREEPKCGGPSFVPCSETDAPISQERPCCRLSMPLS